MIHKPHKHSVWGGGNSITNMVEFTSIEDMIDFTRIEYVQQKRISITEEFLLSPELSCFLEDFSLLNYVMSSVCIDDVT